MSNTSERSFVGPRRLSGSGRVGLWFTAIEPAHDIGADGPRRNLRGLRLLAFAARLFVGRADERAFDEYVSALLDSRGDTLCQKWPEQRPDATRFSSSIRHLRSSRSAVWRLTAR